MHSANIMPHEMKVIEDGQQDSTFDFKYMENDSSAKQ